ncbi:MAG: YihY/virulence factor BrkB family protein [Acidobacteriaceae bacterium]|nr:YihY/virulence factor BrkB family protein [Acidobacteriaceae bacterium]MBV9499960.1 YihY/virulence factor BrkB family protein [Acidobacteriaceae bacterium]
MFSRKTAWKLLKATASKWSRYNTPRLGAALAYYTLLSIAPLLILIVAICGLAFGRQAAERELIGQLTAVAGYSVANTLKSLIDNAHQASTGVLAAGIALVMLFFGASGVFVELRDSLNLIWEAPPSRLSGWRDIIGQRLASFGMILGAGALLLASLVLSTIVTATEKLFSSYLPVGIAIWDEATNFVFFLVAMSALFALIFKFVPEVPVAWRDVAVGAVATAILFDIGKALLALYLGTAAIGSTYGAAGSLVAFVVWVYYSAQIFFFGAVFTKVYAETAGSRALPYVPERGARPEGGPARSDG